MKLSRYPSVYKITKVKYDVVTERHSRRSKVTNMSALIRVYHKMIRNRPKKLFNYSWLSISRSLVTAPLNFVSSGVTCVWSHFVWNWGFINISGYQYFCDWWQQSINQSINIQLYPVVISKTCFSLSKSTILYVNTAYAALYGVLLCKCSIIVILYKAPLFLEYSMPTPIL